MNRRVSDAARERRQARLDRAEAVEPRAIPEHAAVRPLGWGCNPNADGLCLCGCGAPAPICTNDDPQRGYVKGRPRRYIQGHNGRAGDGVRFTTENAKEFAARGGKKSSPTLTAIARRELAKIAPGKERKTYAELVVKGWIDDAIKGKSDARRTLLDRMEGSVPQTIDMTVRSYDEFSADELAAEDARLAAEEMQIEAELAAYLQGVADASAGTGASQAGGPGAATRSQEEAATDR